MVYPTSPLHPSDYDAILREQQSKSTQPKAKVSDSTLPTVAPVAQKSPEKKKFVAQSSLKNKGLEEEMSSNTTAAAKASNDKSKDTVEHKWPGHKLADNVLEAFQRKFGHDGEVPMPQTVPTIEHQIKKTAKDTLNDLKDVFRQTQKEMDRTLDQVQATFGTAPTLQEAAERTALSKEPTFQQQVEKTVHDTKDDFVGVFRQGKKDATDSAFSSKHTSEKKDTEKLDPALLSTPTQE